MQVWGLLGTRQGFLNPPDSLPGTDLVARDEEHPPACELGEDHLFVIPLDAFAGGVTTLGLGWANRSRSGISGP